MSRRSPYLLAATLALSGLLGGHVVIETAFSDPNEIGLVTLLTGRDWPVLSHLLTALPALLALIGLLFSRRTLAVPIPKIGIPLALLGGLAWSSILVADNRASALLGAVEWSSYGLVFFAVVAGGGRAGSRMLLAAIAVGGTMAAALAIRQYGEMRGFDPGFRVQGPWNNPNAIGAYLGIALVAALALGPTSHRAGRLLCFLGAVLIALALALTQSRGAYLTTALGIVVWLAVLGLTRAKTVLPALGTAIGAIALAGVLTVALAHRPAGGASAPGAFGRLGNTQEASVQSVGFRRLLWRSAVDLVRRDPVGKGLNSFGPRSAEPGLVTQTQLAHSTYLQLATEVSPVGAGFFVLFFGIVGAIAFRGAKALEESRKGTLAGAAGALVGILVHSLGDSDAYYFGIGLTIFALAGILLLAASDTSAPELVPANWRWASGGALALVLGMWLLLGVQDRTAAVARGLALSRRPDEARTALDALGPLVDTDGRLLSRRALVDGSAKERLDDLRRAAELAPTTRNLRALAAERLRQGNADGAINTYRQALILDPNNFPALLAIRSIYESTGKIPEAIQTARRTVAIEDSTYYTVRSQAEIVPTATAESRLFLARQTSAQKEMIDLLVPALETFRQYAAKTVPGVVRMDDGAGGSDFGGEDRGKAAIALRDGREAARLLAEAGYRETGLLDEATAAFARAEALLSRDPSRR